jgi:hypothetical protein
MEAGPFASRHETPGYVTHTPAQWCTEGTLNGVGVWVWCSMWVVQCVRGYPTPMCALRGDPIESRATGEATSLVRQSRIGVERAQIWALLCFRTPPL